MGLLGMNIKEEKKKYNHIMVIYDLWYDVKIDDIWYDYDLIPFKIYFNNKWFDKSDWIVLLKYNGEIIKKTNTFKEMDDYIKEVFY